MLAYKSDNIEEELNAAKSSIKILGGQIESVKKIPLNNQIIRSIIIIKKNEKSPENYPRGKNLPRLKPL